MRRVSKASFSVRPWRLLALLFAAALAPAAAFPACLPPSGGDDTAALQAALERCSGARGACTVELCAGVFDTGILRVRNFRGTLRGAGPRATILRARPDLVVSATPVFFREDPFSQDPWPYLLQFVEGKATIRDLGILIPAPPEGSRPTTGWTLFEDVDLTFELRGALLLTGRDPVDFEVSRVRVRAARDLASDLETTAFHGVEFGGLLHNPADPGGFPVLPARGRLQVTDSVFAGVLIGTPLTEVAAANLLVARNRYRAAIAVEVIDAGRSEVVVASNRWDASVRGVQVRQNLDGEPSLASSFLVDDNQGALVPYALGVGDGIAFEDFAAVSPEPGSSALRGTGNRLSLGGATGPAVSGITVKGSAQLRLTGNSLSGAAGTGLDVDVTSGCLVRGNSFGGLETGRGPDLHLGSETSDCVAIVRRRDLVQDDGVNNRVIRR
jgi:parallel beta-helix repeat protein